MQNTRFSQLSQVASTSPKHSRQKFWKIFLSVFHDWKFYPWESREVSRENLCVSLVTGTSTREQVASPSREKHKDPNFEKYSKYFLRLGHWPASELRKISRLGHATGPTRNWVAKIGQYCFWNFWHFCKNRRLSKNN